MKRTPMFPIMAAALLLSNSITASAAPEVIKVNSTTPPTTNKSSWKQASPEVLATNRVNIVFDAEYYAAANPDVAAAIGTDRDALLQHYMETGRVEKRLAYAPDTDINTVFAAAGIPKKRIKHKNCRSSGSKINNGIFDSEYDEQGNLLSETTDMYSAKTGAHAYTDVYTYTYDEHGNMLTKTKVYDDGSSFTENWGHTYDGRGNILSTTRFLTNGEPNYTVAYTYDEYDNVLSITSVPQNGMPDKEIATTTFAYAYDEYGNMLSQTSVDEHGQTWSQTYDKYGNLLINKGTVFKDSNMTETELYTYTSTFNEYGDAVSLTYVTADGKGIQTYAYSETIVYTYDERGNILSKNGVDDRGRTSIANYVYDEYGNLLSEVSKDYIGTVSNITYDGYGNPLSNTFVKSNGDTTTSTYSYVYF